jgi:hypothetical protein
MKQYQTFIFDSYTLNDAKGTIELRYSLDDKIHFTETMTLRSPREAREIDEEALNQALFALHLIGGMSYYKTCVPKTIEVRSGALTENQAAFWNTVYENGLGEFFYRNEIDFRDLIHFPATAEKEERPPSLATEQSAQKPRRVLAPIGGGKDSLVTAELLHEAGVDTTLFRMGRHPFIDELTAATGLPMLTVDRALSGTLFELNAQGALNGHVPVTAYLSTLSVVVSLLYGFDTIAMSNERSASEGNVSFHGKEINHQWSKSIEFELLFQEYLRTSISQSIKYWSLLRPLSELSIVGIFSRFTQYFPLFTSCNKNWRIAAERRSGSRWCGECPKCAFAFLLLSAFLPKQTLLEIFGKNLFDDEALLPTYRELLGLQGCKPFECVGTPDESTAALFLAEDRGELHDTRVMQMFVSEARPRVQDADALLRRVMAPSPEHLLPPEFAALVSRHAPEIAPLYAHP